jgi:co-chaperonin GroES (HSP10)
MNLKPLNQWVLATPHKREKKGSIILTEEKDFKVAEIKAISDLVKTEMPELEVGAKVFYFTALKLDKDNQGKDQLLIDRKSIIAAIE